MASQTYTPGSSCIASVTFVTDDDDDDATSGTAYVTFQQGQQITIENFPAIEVERWMAADSVGNYWNTVFRGKY